MVDYARAAATAKTSIEKNGRTVAIFKANRTPTSASEPWRGNSSAPTVGQGGAEIPVKMVFVPATGSGLGKLLQATGGSLAVAYDQVGLLAVDSIPSTFTVRDVELSDRLRDGTDIWRIVTKGHLKPGDTSILMVLGLKR